MTSQVREFKNDIATSLFVSPCTIDDLVKRDFLIDIFVGHVERFVMFLENDGALYYRGEVMHIKKQWAKDNLADRELDFRTKRQRELEGMTDFKKAVLGF